MKTLPEQSNPDKGQYRVERRRDVDTLPESVRESVRRTAAAFLPDDSKVPEYVPPPSSHCCDSPRESHTQGRRGPSGPGPLGISAHIPAGGSSGAFRRGVPLPSETVPGVPSVRFYRQGVSFCRPVVGSRPEGSGGHREAIVGWSSASRRRMREWLLTHEAQKGWSTEGATFTIPGPVMAREDERVLWVRFCDNVQKAGWGMVWRVEIQARQALHWHCLMVQPFPHPSDIWLMWMAQLRALGPVEGPDSRGNLVKASSRAGWPGADKHAVNLSDKGGKGAWLRYLQDHSTKAKQDQIPVNIGRHWGVVGRSRFVEVAPLVDLSLSDPEYISVVRWWRRLATPSRPNPQAPFGRCLSWSPRRGMRGRSVVFSNPETIARLCDLARFNSRQSSAMGEKAGKARPGLT